jgi:hypothetical protein
MRSVQLVVIAMALLVVQFVLTVSGFAQLNTVPDAERSSITVARPYVPVREVHTEVELPDNLVVSRAYRAVVDAMRVSSPTFRRQCLRIASSPFLTVMIQGDTLPVSSRARAFTRMSRDDWRLNAEIRIGQPENAPELIAHEIEHIIEQLDGVDLASKASLEATGVRRCDCGAVGAFETARAIAVGEQVAREVGGLRR